MNGFITKPALIAENQRIRLENYDLKERIAALEKENTCLSLIGGAAFAGMKQGRRRYSKGSPHAGKASQ
jgi:regulator of replication initiation timing